LQALGPDGMTMLDWDMGRVIGRVTALAVDPANESQVFLGAAAGGLWKSVDGGQSWVQLFDQIGTESVGSILLENGNPDHVWVGTGEANAGCIDYFGLASSIPATADKPSKRATAAATRRCRFLSSRRSRNRPADPNVLIVGGQGHCNANGSSSAAGFIAHRRRTDLDTSAGRERLA